MRDHRLPETKSVGWQQSGQKIWAELSFLDFTEVSRFEASVGGIFAMRLLYALIRERLEAVACESPANPFRVDPANRDLIVPAASGGSEQPHGAKW
jgi:hypothetical protein